MKTNIFIKSMLRQPLRSFLLVALIGLAAFAFVLRTAEYMIVRRQIMSAAEGYRAIGFINHPAWFGDVSEGLELLRYSPYIGHANRRRAAEGILVDMHNADTSGMRPLLAHNRDGRGLQPRLTEVYIYAYLEDIFLRNRDIVLQIRVDEVLVGHPEHAIPGQTLFITYRPGVFSYRYALANMEIGQRYLFVAAYLRVYPPRPPLSDILSPNPLHGPVVPIIGCSTNWLHLFPLNEEGSPPEHIWYVHVPTGHTADFTLPELAHIPAHIQLLNRDQRSMQIQAVTDMSMLPEIDRSIELHEGRLLNRDDYYNANPVVVIDIHFALARGLEVGDTVTVNIPRLQNYVGAIRAPGFTTPLVRVDRAYPERYYDAIEVELTIVGITRFATFTRDSTQSLFMFIPDSLLPEDYAIQWIQMGWGYWEDGRRGAVPMPPIDFGSEHMPDVWNSFVLADAREERAFYNEYRWLIYNLDMDLVVYFANPGNFWISAQPVLLTITFNAILFWVVLALVLVLVAFIYLRQRRNEFAIMRALGQPVRSIYLCLITTILLFGLPAMAIGGTAAWFIAHSEAQVTLEHFEDAYDEITPLTPSELLWQTHFGDRPMPEHWAGESIAYGAGLTMYWLAALIGIVLLLMLFIVTSGSLKMLRLPVLVQLQGGVAMADAKILPDEHEQFKSPTSAKAIMSQISQRASTPLKPFPADKITRKDGLKGYTRWIRVHIQRSPIKTALGVAITVFFIMVLGWLQESINQTQREIDRLYDTTIVRADVIMCPESGPNDLMFNEVIRGRTLERIMDTGYVYGTYKEAVLAMAFIIPPNAEGTLRHDWRMRIGLSVLRQWAGREFVLEVKDFILGTTDLNTFMERHTIAANPHAIVTTEDMEDLSLSLSLTPAQRGLRNISITFAPGYDASVFDYDGFTPGDVVPIIVSRHTLRQRGRESLRLGDYTLLVYQRMGAWEYVNAKIVGIHNSQIFIENMQDGMIVPYWFFETMLAGIPYSYTTLAIDIVPTYNRNLPPIRTELERIIRAGTSTDPTGARGNPPLQLLFHDSELRSVVSTMNQILLLLELIHPIAIGLALIIGAGLAMLLMLQNMKNAAIMRVLGTSLHKTRLVLWAEQIVVGLVGLVLGLAALMLTGRSLEAVIALAGLYIAGVMLGAVVGAVIVTWKAPLDLLQVRE